MFLHVYIQFSLAFYKTETEQENIEAASHLHIRNWMVSLMSNGISARSINRKISSLHSFYKFLIRKAIVAKSPMAKVQNPKVKKRLPAFVDETGMDQLFQQVQFPTGYEGARDRLVLELLYGTGIRRSELLGLCERDFDSYQSQIKVLGKGNKERIIPIQPILCKALQEFIVLKKQLEYSSEFVFLNKNGRTMTANALYVMVKKYLQLVTTVEKKSPHVLRHTYATHLMNNGADINAVKELLGHSSLAATQVYTHNTIDKLKNIYKQAHPRA